MSGRTGQPDLAERVSDYLLDLNLTKLAMATGPDYSCGVAIATPDGHMHSLSPVKGLVYHVVHPDRSMPGVVKPEAYQPLDLIHEAESGMGWFTATMSVVGVGLAR
ncbi:hypothetical protein ACK389_35695 [Streptomyces antibioticus]|uniref:hypothetical protein n=1 Tax=Streptomyces antibioticus TaxID=1890 RepID=UPI000A652DAA